MNLTPEFVEAAKKYHQLIDSLGTDHPDTRRATRLVMELTPDELKYKIVEKLLKLILSEYSDLATSERLRKMLFEDYGIALNGLEEEAVFVDKALGDEFSGDKYLH